MKKLKQVSAGKIYYFTHCSDEVVNGGASRDFAFFVHIKNISDPCIKIISLHSSNFLQRLYRFFECVTLFLYIKNSTVLLHQNSIFSIFSGKLLNFRLYRFVVFQLLNRLSARNRFILEINDLRYEQAIDFGLCFDRSGYLNVQTNLLGIKNAEFIFASEGMRNMAILKYGVKPSVGYTIINGGILDDQANLIQSSEASKWICTDTLNCVYAGGLIKGRQILEIVSIFKDLPGVSLILLGDDGEWLNEYPLPNNINFIGSLPERLAHEVVSQCDLGLIPYDDKLPYYNLCYPTKASFYITAGIPFLCTRLNELARVFGDTGFVFFSSLDEWPDELKKMNKKKITDLKIEIEKARSIYSWQHILAPLEGILRGI
ncbi:MAG: hypothetical protein ACOYBT_08370 [Polynucleobacter sp.]